LIQARLIKVLDETYRPDPSNILEVVYIFLPLQSATFNSLNTSAVSSSTRVIFYKQALASLAWLHDKMGIAHRDIKPANLVVGRYDPPSMMIIDLGCATLETKVLYDRPGTVPYEKCGRRLTFWTHLLIS
jgi:serine/threonine protein kinase